MWNGTHIGPAKRSHRVTLLPGTKAALMDLPLYLPLWTVKRNSSVECTRQCAQARFGSHSVLQLKYVAGTAAYKSIKCRLDMDSETGWASHPCEETRNRIWDFDIERGYERRKDTKTDKGIAEVTRRSHRFSTTSRTPSYGARKSHSTRGIIRTNP